MPELSARRLILNVVTARPETTFSIADLCRAASVVDVAESNVRMAVTRLAKDGILRRVQRGAYAFDPSALPTYEHVRHWRHRLDQLEAWDGSWVAVETSEVDRQRRSVFNRLHRELTLQGMIPWRGGLYVRPRNLHDALMSARHQLGDTGATAFILTELDESEINRLRDAWEPQQRHDRYRKLIERLDDSRERSRDQTTQEFARDSLLLGSEAIAEVVRDPLLPDELDDKKRLRDLVPALIDYQDQAQEAWAQLLWDDPA